MITPDGCSMMNRAVENMELLKTMGKDKPKFFFEYMEIPMKADDNGLNLYVLQCRNHILTPLHDVYGIDVSDAAVRKAVAEHNRVCELIRAIGEYRKGPNPRITGYECHVIALATYVAPNYQHSHKHEDPYMNMSKMIGRREYVNQLAKEYGADGIIYEQIKFCDPWAYERMLGSHILNDDYGYPVLSVDRPYNIASSGQMRTRVQAFVESMEIKKIQGGKQ